MVILFGRIKQEHFFLSDDLFIFQIKCVQDEEISGYLGFSVFLCNMHIFVFDDGDSEYLARKISRY